MLNNHVADGRRKILVDETEVTPDNILTILDKAMLVHCINRSEIEYLYNYYRGVQPILDKEKQVRPEINNKVVENRANEIVSFKSGYLMGESVQYVARSEEDVSDAINALNQYVYADEKFTKDKELVDWFHICGTAFRMVLPSDTQDADSPFQIFTLDPRDTFVVYNNGLGERPILGVRYVTDAEGNTTYSCYSDTDYYEIRTPYMADGISGVSTVNAVQHHILGAVPIIEYPLNMARIGSFETVIPILDAINAVDSNRLDDVEQTVQSILLFRNTDITDDSFAKLRQEGALRFRDVDAGMPAEVKYISCSLNEGEIQTLTNHLYQTVLTICGMPNRNGSSSTSDTGSAVIMRDGWSDAEAYAKNAESCFQRSEREFLRIALRICKTMTGMDLSVSNIEIRFTRRNYENILQKAQVLDLLLKNGKIHPRLAFEHSGMFVDPDLAYTESKEYLEAQSVETTPTREQTDAQSQELPAGADENEEPAAV